MLEGFGEGMIWKGELVTLSNYERVFDGFSKDVLEVIRSALFDCTPIEKYINRFSNNPYMLWQVKLGIDEGLDDDWFYICPSGDTLLKIRELRFKNINLNALKSILSGSNLSEVYFKYILRWYEKGIYLGKYNFSILPEDLLEVFNYGINLGYPMYIFNNGVHFSYEYIIGCLRLLSNGKKVDKFLKGDWDIVNISLLADYSKSKYYDKFIDYITNSITPSVLEEIYKCCRVGMPLKGVTSLDSDGLYLYNGVIINLAREAFLKKFDYGRLLEPGISVVDATSIMHEMELNATKNISGRLRRGLKENAENTLKN